MTTLEQYTKGAKVWIAHAQKVWEGAVLLEDYHPNKSSLQVRTDGNEKKTLAIKSEQDLPHLRNPQILIGENDLTSLSYLHEPAVLYNLQVRFCQQKHIYTYCGIVLVAVNPYDDLPIYDTETIMAYRGQAMGDLDPHIFAVAEEAYTKLEREQRDQSIIVSGESGAGKTVSAKYAMRYFATVGGSCTETQIERRVLASSPIMEAIGNAKTTRNDNSSRFGKFIELQFNLQYNIIGASMRTYLLEKSRVVFQTTDERNYHIFYQLCAARDSLPHLHLKSQDDYHYLNQGENTIIEGVSDSKTFEETRSAFTMLGFTNDEQNDIFKTLAAVLHLGNVPFVEQQEHDQESCRIPSRDDGLAIACELLDIDKDEMEQWLCTKRLISMNDVILKPMSVQQANTSRNALAKHIYSELFNWIVFTINKALEATASKHKFIGVLDIYGFETFQINSFEQFCINYANEKLQQIFNMHVFKLEQEEYIKEEIQWKMIEFYDNQPCIDLIEAKLGILDLLDEECKMPKGTDTSWVEKLYTKCTRYKHFSKARFGTTAFVINHFADQVQYESGGFLDKNRDTVIDEQVTVLRSSTNSFVARLFSNSSRKLSVPSSGSRLKVVSAKPLPVSKKSNKKTVGSQFRDSLNLLMATLNATTPHYVRCIKPNDTKTAFEYNPQRAVQQLRACGVLETIRISAAGFPSRWTYVDFFYRYRVLCKFQDIMRNDMKRTCEAILKQYIKVASVYQFGKSKIFFRAGQVAYLEKLRADKMMKCCIIIQSTVRAFIYRKRYLKIQRSVRNIQRYGRGVLARRRAENLRRNKAAVTLQRYIRGWVKRIQYQRLRRSVLHIQTRARGCLARRRFMAMKYNAKAIVIQKHVRGWLARKQFKLRIRHIVICQAAIRRFLAKRQYKKLRIEARSIEHVKKLNKGLENKIISMQQKIEEINKNNNELKHFHNEAIELRAKLTTFRALEVEIRNLNNLLIEKNKLIGRLQETIKTEQDEKMDLVEEQEKFRKETVEQRDLWNQEMSKVRKELENMNEIIAQNERGAEEKLQIRLEEEKMLFINEQDNDRQAYQQLLQEYHSLEQRCETLEHQLTSQTFHSSHRRNVSDISSTSIADEGPLSSSDIPEDRGYGSTRSTASTSSTREKLEDIDWNRDSGDNLSTTSTLPAGQGPTDQQIDVALILKLQQKLSDVEKEKDRLQKRVDEFEMSPKTEKAENAAYDAMRISELEVSNCTLKTQLFELTNSIEDGSGKEQLITLIRTSQTEIERRGEEIVQLKSVLATQTSNMKSIVNCRSKTGEYINEDGELALAYETQKTINKQLELELQDEKTKFKTYEKEYKIEIEKLREDNERQQRLLAMNLTTTPQTQTEAFMQHEITRLTRENLQLQDRSDSLAENVRKLKRQVKLLTKKLQESGVDVDQTLAEAPKIDEDIGESQRPMPMVRKKDKAYLGMFACKTDDVNPVMKQLMIELKPRKAVTLLPGLPAYIVFMCIRHADHINEEENIKAILSAYSAYLKKVIKKRHEDIETSVLWLSNTLRLVHCMKQYSGDKRFQEKNTSKQNKQCLRNFDLTEYRRLLSDNSFWIYNGLIANFEEKVQSLIVPAVLEHEEIPGISGNKQSGFRTRSSSLREIDSPDGGKQKPTEALLEQLNSHYKILMFYGIDPEVITQIFRQIFYFISASSLNNLLLRKELCHWSKGSQIRHNLSHLELWMKEKQLAGDEKSITAALQPILQAAYLLQARKEEEEDVDRVCEMCTSLTELQILKILNLYTPLDDYEPRVPISFIRKVQTKLQETKSSQAQQTLLMDIKHIHPVKFPFNPSPVCLEDIEIPKDLKLPWLQKV